jgi:FkbM family methyltransferase
MMFSLSQLSTLIRRSWKARELGFSFTGTKRFKPPSQFLLSDEWRKLQFPADPSAGLDVIDVWLDDDYGLADIRSPVHTVVDVGANIGLFSLWARRAFPNSTIHAYEPNPDILPICQANLSGVPAISVYGEAISDRDGYGRLELVSDSSRLSKVSVVEFGTLRLCSLRTAVQRIGGSIDLLKLDCKGGEWSIFADPKVFEQVRDIRMEYHLTDGRQVEDVRKAAQDIGFEVLELHENNGFGLAYLKNRKLEATTA